MTAGHVFRFDALGLTGTPCAPYRGPIINAKSKTGRKREVSRRWP
jgi:hypothetical protein